MNASLFRLVCAIGALTLLTQCVAWDDPYYGGGYSSGYSSSYYDGPSYFSSPSYGGYYGGGGYYSRPRPYYGYNSSSLCPTCHRNPCCCRNHSSHNHSSSNNSSHHHSANRSSSSSSRDRDVGLIGRSFGQTARSSSSSSGSQRRDSDGDKLYRYSSRDKDMPKGNHSKEWYKDRGYDLGKLKPSR
ncbi:MAG: hypothetical protein JNJ83_17635 [Verrucomicrobiaceae bacterium]|nr:hypothetical protein [Verrucomicrobiaceae bacterium]